MRRPGFGDLPAPTRTLAAASIAALLASCAAVRTASDAAASDAPASDAADDAALGAHDTGASSDAGPPIDCGAVILAAGLRCEVLGGTLRSPRDVEVTRAGEIVVTEFGAGRLARLRGGAWETIAEGLAGPIGVREWSDGRLLVGEEHARSVSWIDPEDGTRTPLAGELGSVTYVARGASGAIFVSTFVAATRGAGVVHRIDPATGAAMPFATGLDVPEGLFVDGDGSLFVAEWDTPSAVRRFPSEGGSVAASELVASGFDRIYGLLPDGEGGLFAGDHAGRIVRVRADRTTEIVVDAIGRPGGLARDATGALLVAELVDFGADGRVLRISGL